MARTGAIIFTWGAGVPGRERMGLEVFGGALGYWEEMAKEGRIIGHREYFSSNRSGGYMIVEGLLPDLHQIAQEDDFLKLNARAEAIVEDFRMELCLGGSDQAIQEGVGLFNETLDELGF